MIIVTGATGQLGRAIIERLPATEVVATVRDPAKASDLEARGVRVRQADFEDPATLPKAFDGASQVLIISGPADPAPHEAAISAAKAAGAERILYTSHQAASPRSAFAAAVAHAQTEQDLEASGVAWTALRNGFYATAAIHLMGQAITTGKLVAPEDGPVSWTAHADLADAAVIALTEPDRLYGPSPVLTGPEALDFTDIARIASELTGHEITRVTVRDDQWLDTMRSHGVPEATATFLLGIFHASRNGEFNVVDPTVGRLLGHDPIPFRDVLARVTSKMTEVAGQCPTVRLGERRTCSREAARAGLVALKFRAELPIDAVIRLRPRCLAMPLLSPQLRPLFASIASGASMTAAIAVAGIVAFGAFELADGAPQQEQSTPSSITLAAVPRQRVPSPSPSGRPAASESSAPARRPVPAARRATISRPATSRRHIPPKRRAHRMPTDRSLSAAGPAQSPAPPAQPTAATTPPAVPAAAESPSGRTPEAQESTPARPRPTPPGHVRVKPRGAHPQVPATTASPQQRPEHAGGRAAPIAEPQITATPGPPAAPPGHANGHTDPPGADHGRGHGPKR